MESIFFDLNPSMKQFTDNALRANNMLHKAQHHESKAKTSKASKAAGSNIGTDTAFSGDDMMGGMDLGDFRGGGSSAFESFKQSDDDSDSQDRKPPNLAAMMSYVKNFPTSESVSNTYQEQKQKINTEQTPIPENSSNNNIVNQEQGTENNLNIDENKTESILENTSNIENNKETQYSEEDSNISKLGKEPSNISFDETNDTDSETKNGSESNNEKIDKRKKESISKSQEKIIISEEPKKETKTQKEQSIEKKESAWNSLLSFDEGFLIATDEKFLQLGAVDEVNPEEPKAASFETISIPKIDSSISEAEILNAMIPVNAFGDYEHSMLIYYLSFYGKKVLKLCADFGIKILPNGLNENLGRYSKNEKTCFILPSSLNSNELFIAPRLYMAVAFDHALGGEDFSSEKSPAVLSSWQLCRDRTPGHLFQDLFSASTPSRYFAQSIESFLRQKDECPTSYFFSHDQLYDYDRSMFSYIEYLFNQMKG